MKNHLTDILEKAIKAPSSHNTQPWKFKVDENEIIILPDYERSLPVVDPDNHALFISLGCALENLMIAANNFGYDANIQMNFDVESTANIKVNLIPSMAKSNEELFNCIDKRQSTRNKYDGAAISQLDLDKINSACRQDEVECLIITDKKDMEPIIELVKEATILQFNNKAFMDELTHWIRFNTTAGEETGDGLYGKTTGNPSVPEWFGKFFINVTMSPEKEAKKYAELIRSSSAIIIFIAKRNDKKAWVNVGRSFERMALTATSLNINNAHENMPCEEVSVRQKLIQQLHLKDGKQPLLFTRIGYSEKMPYSFRRPLQDVIVKN